MRVVFDQIGRIATEHGKTPKEVVMLGKLDSYDGKSLLCKAGDKSGQSKCYPTCLAKCIKDHYSLTYLL